MTDWYYHDPAQGRVGPYTGEQLRARYRERRIQRDTLVWHAGLREWQPLDRCSEELELDGVQPDASLPPPLPPPTASTASVGAYAPRPGVARSRTAGRSEPKRGLSGCAIVAIVLAALTIPAIGILAAIAIPAYQDYTIRAKTTAGLYGAAVAIERAVDAHRERSGRCPSDADMAPLAQGLAQAQPGSGLRFGSIEGDCAFEITIRGAAQAIDGRTWLFASTGGGDWDCSGGDLPARYRPQICRAE